MILSLLNPLKPLAVRKLRSSILVACKRYVLPFGRRATSRLILNS